MEDAKLVRLLSQVQPGGRDVLRRAMRTDQLERGELAIRLLRARAYDLADLIDLATVDPELRRQIARVLGELESAD